MTAKLRTWWHPPTIDHSSNAATPDGYFRRKLFLWMPRKMWFICLVCDKCRQPLRSKGLYRKVRVVIDVRDTYYLAGEYMDCNTGGCMSIYISWDKRILEQLPDSVLARFPVVLTYRYACDRTVVGLLRARTLGNSPTALWHNILESHSEEWLKRQMMYLGDCARFKESRQKLGLHTVEYPEAPPFPIFPKPNWFITVYVRDVWNRLPTMLASLMSTYGCILKIDSSKKICKKMQGAAAVQGWPTGLPAWETRGMKWCFPS